MAVFPVFPVFPFGAVRARRACGPKSATICLCLWTTVDESSWESHQKKRRRLAFIIPGLVLLCLALTAGVAFWGYSPVLLPQSNRGSTTWEQLPGGRGCPHLGLGTSHQSICFARFLLPE